MMAAIARAFGRASRPLAFYYGIAVAVPVLNGGTFDRLFLEHVAFVLVVPLVIVTAAGCAARLALLWTVSDRHALGDNWLAQAERRETRAQIPAPDRSDPPSTLKPRCAAAEASNARARPANTA